MKTVESLNDIVV